MSFFAEIFEYRFLSMAAIACLLSGIACGVVGTYMVCRRSVFMSGGITHASFGGIGIAYYMGINPLIGAFVFAILSALGIERLTRKGEIREDSAVGILWSVGMAIGIVFIHLTPGYAPNLMTFLFGNILTVSSTDLIIMALLDVVIVALFATSARQIMYVAFDREYAESQRVPVNVISYVMAVLTAMTIVVSIRVVGIVLLISLMTIPVVIANSFTKSFMRIMWISPIIAALSVFLGLFISYKADMPSGATTIFVLAVSLIAVKLLPLQSVSRK